MATTTAGGLRLRHVAGTTPYAWPWNGLLDAAGTAVLLIDAPGPTAANRGDRGRNATVVVATLRRSGGMAIRVQTRRPASPRFAVGRASAIGGGEPGDVPVDAAVTSQGVDGFFGSPLEAMLRQNRIERVLLVGAWLETSVHSTMRTANDMGFECLLVVDACTPGDEALVASSVSMIEMSGGIFGAIGTTARVVEAYAHEGERP